jgi:cytochrome bd-type quinol oxidase subunit 2
MTALSEDSYNILKEQIANLEKKNDNLDNSIGIKTRVNTYTESVSLYSIYTYRILLVLYSMIYIVLLYTLFTYRASISIVNIIGIAIIFAAFPYIIDIIASYAYNTFIKILHYLYKGNSVFLYKPSDEPLDTL